MKELLQKLLEYYNKEAEFYISENYTLYDALCDANTDGVITRDERIELISYLTVKGVVYDLDIEWIKQEINKL